MSVIGDGKGISDQLACAQVMAGRRQAGLYDAQAGLADIARRPRVIVVYCRRVSISSQVVVIPQQVDIVALDIRSQLIVEYRVALQIQAHDLSLEGDRD